MEIRRSYDRLISTMGFPILVRWHLYIESGPRSYVFLALSNPHIFAKVEYVAPYLAVLRLTAKSQSRETIA